MVSRATKEPLRFLQEDELRELGKVLVAAAFGAAVLATLFVDPPGTSPTLWLLLFVSAVAAGYLYGERGIVAATVLGLACLGITMMRAYPSPSIFLPFVAMIALASLASNIGQSTRERTRYRKAMGQAPGGTFLLRRKGGTIMDANNDFAELLGRPRRDLQGLPVSKIWPNADDRERFFAQAQPDAGNVVVETQFVDRDGKTRWFILWGRCPEDAVIACRVSEITRYKETEAALGAERRYLISILDTLPAYITVQGEDHTIRFANRAFREAFGDPESGRCYEVQRGSCDPCDFCRGAAVFIHGNPQQWEWDHADGKTYEVHAYPFTGTDGSPLMLQLGVDVTRRVHAEEALKWFAGDLQAKNQELELLRGQLSLTNLELDAMVRERTADVEKLLAQKNEFISHLGHDLKTPLTPLVALMPILIEREQDPAFRRLLEISGRNITFMKEMVQKTLQLARLNSLYIELDPEPLDLQTELNNTLQNHTALFTEKGITLDNNVPPGITVRADRVLLGEVFNGLITNAVKYMQDGGGTITINAVRGQEGVTVSVRDTGIGMTGEQLDQVFVEYYKADASRHDLESPGLGLTICKRIVERHGGRIWAESDGEGMGTTVLFTLKTVDGP